MGDGQLHLVDLWGIGLGVGLFAIFLMWHDLVAEVARLARVFQERYVVTSTGVDEDVLEDAAGTGIEPSRPMPILRDTVAENASTPGQPSTLPSKGISRRMSDVELIALLSVQRTAEGKYRFSANVIAGAMGGTRADVLDQVRAIRNLPSFTPITPEQQRTREVLELER